MSAACCVSCRYFCVMNVVWDCRNALHIAVCDDKLDIVKLLVEAGADMDYEDRWGNSAYDEAVKANNRTILEYLDGVKAQKAAEGGHVSVHKGASITVFAQARQTPFTSTGRRSSKPVPRCVISLFVQITEKWSHCGLFCCVTAVHMLKQRTGLLNSAVSSRTTARRRRNS